MNVGIESGPGYREREQPEEWIENEEPAASAECSFVSRENAGQLRQQSQSEREIESHQYLQEKENRENRASLRFSHAR